MFHNENNSGHTADQPGQLTTLERSAVRMNLVRDLFGMLGRTHGLDAEYPGTLDSFSQDGPERFGQRYSAEVFAKAIELRLEGMPYKKLAAESVHRFSISATKSQRRP